ncbi:MAG: 4-hydroxy-3-methylbut-2-enyl diphosphate reductase [Leadbetterella sp.]|nr:4-hydroxy-3-methylbut-2-enyl diphosphate reductase [Leadbetterella sp.]
MKTFDIPVKYKSPVISVIKETRRAKDKLKRNFKPTVLEFERLTILIARHFGFCYGVENAVEIAYRTLNENRGKRVFLLSEMIHNPDVNADLLSEGVQFLMDTKGNRLISFETLTSEDIVIVPAFGTTLEIQAELSSRGIDPYGYDTTCPFVEKVWNRANQIGERGYTVVVHGKPNHEETRATFSHSTSQANTVVIKDIGEARELAVYIRKEKPGEEFYRRFEGRYSEGFDPEKHLVKLGVVNQTTMLASETQEIANYLKEELVRFYGLDESSVSQHFASTKDTLCYATNDNQDATYALMEENADPAIVVGGYNSSNTTHLVELLEQKIPTYFIKSAAGILSDREIIHFDIHRGEEVLSRDYLPEIINPKIILTCGASCPDAVVEEVLARLLELFQEKKNLEGVLEKSLVNF